MSFQSFFFVLYSFFEVLFEKLQNYSPGLSVLSRLSFIPVTELFLSLWLTHRPVRNLLQMVFLIQCVLCTTIRRFYITTRPNFFLALQNPYPKEIHSPIFSTSFDKPWEGFSRIPLHSVLVRYDYYWMRFLNSLRGVQCTFYFIYFFFALFYYLSLQFWLKYVYATSTQYNRIFQPISLTQLS